MLDDNLTQDLGALLPGASTEAGTTRRTALRAALGGTGWLGQCASGQLCAQAMLPKRAKLQARAQRAQPWKKDIEPPAESSKAAP